MTADPLERCHCCDELRGDVRPIRLIESASGPGWTVRECRTCTPHCDLDTILAQIAGALR
ncbi:hypothetical protein QNO07_09135 [Streptomyces sp. 549]|uniref:hypothetical protein n=1 Tax=Streptomyces sp. 549 TaxID=3049076 RepID=UPI0024C2970C|nr:hypothetical protein [Streptomyces sp. 549]MDK1473581.1 hypothetical protein [Streptomyces sp. 549]